MERTFLEKIGILFAVTVYVEGIIKDLIIFKKNPQYIEEINNKVISEGLSKERAEMSKKTFSLDMINEFSILFNLEDREIELFNLIRLTRNIFWHCRIWVNDQTIRYTASSPKRWKEVKEAFKLKWEWEILKLTKEDLNFEARTEQIWILDDEFLPEYATRIWLKYERLR